VCGLDKLRWFANTAWGAKKDTGSEETTSEKIIGRSSKPRSFKISTSSGFELEPRRLLIFGGKGGVGKTTAAAATALALAEKGKRSRVLVCSTDPAHSLSDSFGEKIGELKQGVVGQTNLDASEVDSFARFEAMRDRYRQWIDEFFESLTAGSRWEIQFDREAMREIVSLAPPGMDEIAALSAVIDLLDESNYTTIVLDTAPTGHLVRFLELPEIALSWIHTFMKLLLKYKSVTDWGSIAEELLAMSKNIKRLVALMTDPRKCEFIAVAIPEQMSLKETLRLTESLDQLKVPLSRLLINNVVPVEAAASCDFCSTRRSGQESVIRDFCRQFKNRLNIYIAPQQSYEINGQERLRAHFSDWHPVMNSDQ
jgi:arsenite-transporting ATPase